MWKSIRLCKRLLISVPLLLVFWMTALGFGQEWEKTFGGPEYDFGYCIDQTDDEGFIIVGRTDLFVKLKNDPNDIYLIKTDSHGNELWTKTFGGKAWDE